MRTALGCFFGGMIASLGASAEVATAPHVRVEYKGLSADAARAIAETTSAAWGAYASDFGFALAEISVDATCEAGQSTRLYTDGQDRFFLTIADASKLDRPAKSGVFNLYGICHELGHIAQYRILKDRDWMTTAAAEGWAHYAGSMIVDRVYEAKGEKLWHDPYDYREDGGKRLRKQLADKNPSDVTRGAGQWQELEGIIGRPGFAKLFAAWQAAKIDPSDAADALLAAAKREFPAHKDKLESWWKAAGPLFVEKRERSDVQAVTIDAGKLSSQPLTLAGDDDSADGRKSIAGGGHAKRFDAPAGEWYVRRVALFGARYGEAKAPDESFEIALCDEELRPIATWSKPYSTFERGELKWVWIDVPPTRVPPKFCLCFVFKPTGTKGVFAGFDAAKKGDSQVGVPGKPGKPFDGGEWMIRVELDRPAAADALGPGK